MHFASINIPEELVQAHAEGQVVFFVGAGASMGRPTSLPSFDELTRRIAELARLPAPDEEKLKQPDVYLGSIDKISGVDVHTHVKREIKRGRRRNAMHDALASLAAAPGAVRLVTTNFDNFLDVALKAQGHRVEIFKGPSVPLGDKFEGIVHLHGHRSQSSRSLVVTDSDFGEAYITRGWAPAFLRALFSTYVVCFVGYSHEDRMMDYFAKGLTSGARRRYIFTDRDDPSHWAALGVTPITYERDAHQDLVDALTRWSIWSSSSSYDRAQRVRLFQGGAPPSDPDDADFLLSALEDPALVDEVCDIARGKDWAQWMVAQTPTRALARDSISSGRGLHYASTLAYWAAREGTNSDCWQVIYNFLLAEELKCAPVLIEAILQGLIRDQMAPEIRSTWLRWSFGMDLGGENGGRTYLELLWSSDVELSEQDTLLLLDKIVDDWSPPRPSSFGGIRGADTSANEWQLRTGIKRRVIDSDALSRRPVLIWVTSFFEKAHRLAAEGEKRFDPWSFSRSAIEPHHQDQGGLYRAASALIDMARDLLKAHRVNEPADADRFRELWSGSDAPLLRRIAIHDLRTDTDAPLATKLEELISRSRLFETDVHHETYLLIADIAPLLDAESMAALIAAIVDGPPPGGPNDALSTNYRDRRVYELLHWVLRWAPGTHNPAALDAIQERYPEWRARSHPDLTVYMESGSRSIEDDWPWKPQEFHEMIGADPRGALAQFGQQPRSAEGDAWWGAGNMLVRTVEQWPDDGFDVWRLTDDESIRGCVVEGWASSALDEAQLVRIADLLLGVDLTDLARSVVRLLIPWSNNDGLRRRWSMRPAGRALARRIVPYVADKGSNITGADPRTMAINTPVGQLAEFWTVAAIEEARAGIYPGGLLSDEIRTAIEELLESSLNSQIVEIALLGHLLFFHRADPAWAQARLLPLLDPEVRSWSDVEPAWSVVLSGQAGESLLDAGVREWLIKCGERVVSGSPIRRDLTRWISIVAVNSTMANTDRVAWLRSLVAAGSDEFRADWTSDIGRRFSDLDDGHRLATWKQWMNDYIRRRVSGDPRTLADSELTGVIAWVAELPPGLELAAGLKLLSRVACGLAPNGSWSAFPVSLEAVKHNPDAWAILLAKLLGRTNQIGSIWGRDLRSIHTFLKSAKIGSNVVNDIEAELFRLGVR